MKRLLTSTTALSLALFNVQPWPLMAQTLTEDGSVIAADGTVLCAALDGVVCIPEDYVDQAAAIDAAMAADAAAAQVEVDAAVAAQVQADADAAAAAEAQAQADAAAVAAADAQVQADADAAAAAAAQAQAEADSQAQAQADADAAAAADAQAQADADAAAAAVAQAQADADAAAAADAQAKADADAAAAADAQAKADADAAAADAAAQADATAAADAQAKADADAATAADADAKAAADAAIQAAADADAKAAADAAVAADADAALKAQLDADAAAAALADAAAAEAASIAAADAAAKAGADTATQEAADAAAKAAADAAAQAVIDAQAATDAAAKATQDAADAAAAATALPDAPEAVVDVPVVDPALVDENGVALLPDAPEVQPDTIIDAPVLTAEEQAALDAAAALQAETDAAALAAAEAELKVQTDGTLVDPAAGLKTADVPVDQNLTPVDVIVPTDTEVQTLSTLMAEPEAGVDPATLGAAAGLAAMAVAGAEAIPLVDQPVSPDAVSTVTELLTEQSARASTMEFAAAPVTVAEGKKNRLSDLEKVGLVVLGALVVGAIINQGNKKEERRVVSNTGDRIVVLKPDGTYQVYKDDDAVIRRPGSTVRTETYNDGSTRTIVDRGDGTQIVTIRDATGRVLRRAHYDNLGRELVLIDDLEPEEVVYVRDLPKPKTKRVVISTQDEDADLKAALAARDIAKLGRTFSLRQIREIAEVRALAATIDVDTITFDSGSSAIKASEAQDLADLGRLMQDMIDNNPREMFLIEGHTDATGKAALNLALSDRRAESVALALTEYFDIPPENMVIQGYGETELRIDTLRDEPRNRRVAVRIITPLMRVNVAAN